MISVFTATYNRAHTLTRLYQSLCSQSYLDFEWIIVDDGSSDTTEELVKQWQNENKIKIAFLKQKNGGKHSAFNKGVQLAKGNLFFNVDSDDYLLSTSLEVIKGTYENASKKYNIAGIAGRRMYENGTIVGNQNFDELLSNSIDIRYQYGVIGDLVEVFELEKLREFSFPEIENEKFCPEALVWNRLATKYNLFFFNKGIYVTQYLPDGLTAKITKIRMESPIASINYYGELEKYDIPWLQKIKANINFWRFSFNCQSTLFNHFKKVKIIYTIIGLPIGFMMYVKDKLSI
ncbi:Glycosyl transferase [Flavobacterium sp. 9AF]|uniref:glycosyltransferase family A protein n=1 Tax=Flavobacterium sp. 9AF TaxID=2653142 RepID=UPI0012EF995E|nr:glycosyltransferase family A protein [Flavobacterium sp. 9AF]VXC30683.1 Glycosyl transferase [Flavobacterium sp. 9AF]